MSAIRTNAAAALLGVSPNTLRSWERRFGYPTPRRTEGGHRQFDLAEIEALRQAFARDAGHLLGDLGGTRARRRTLDPRALAIGVRGVQRGAGGSPAGGEPGGALGGAHRRVGAAAGGGGDRPDEEVERRSEVLAGSPEYCFAWRYATGWLAAAQRVAPPRDARGGRVDLRREPPAELDALYVQALELFLRRAGLRVLTLPVELDSTRVGNACARLRPGAVVLGGRCSSLDAIGRLVYATRQCAGELEVLDYRGALPDTGASTVATHRRGTGRGAGNAA